jgi:hypothetical protein
LVTLRQDVQTLTAGLKEFGQELCALIDSVRQRQNEQQRDYENVTHKRQKRL